MQAQFYFFNKIKKVFIGGICLTINAVKIYNYFVKLYLFEHTKKGYI